MTFTEMMDGITVEIHLQGMELNDYLRKKILASVKGLKTIADDIIKINLRLTQSEGDVKSPRTVTADVEVPDLIFTASDSGTHWKMLIPHVEKRIARRLHKRNELLRKQAVINPMIASSIFQ